MRYIFFFAIIVLNCSVFSQQADYVDFKKVKAEISFDVKEKKVFGKVSYRFEILKTLDSIYLDAKHTEIFDLQLLGNGAHVKIEYKDFKFVNNSKHIILYDVFTEGFNYELKFNYSVQPRKALYFVEKGEDIQVWTQGQGKYTSNWLPSIDDMNEKMEFDMSITFDSDYQVISNGKLTNKQTNESVTIWHYDMKKPMPSYLVAMAIGKYDKKVAYSESGIPLKMYYYPKDSLKFEPTYRYTKEIFNFFEDEIGEPYPWQNYKQIPVHDFLYAGMENTGTTIFSDDYVVDERAFNDHNYVNVNAHEMAHQWFGNLVTATHGTHHWLQEGFATYYALLAEREVFGKRYFYNRLLEYANNLKFQDDIDQGTALLDPKASSTTFYQRGAWALHTLSGLVGEEVFKLAVKNYLKKYQFKNANTSNFLEEVKILTDQDLSKFKLDWLEATTFPYDHAMEILSFESGFIEQYKQVDCEVYSPKCDYWLEADISPEAKAKLISQIPDKITKSTFTFGPKVRQAIAHYVTDIPLNLKKDYESLLMDDSYVTVQYALLNLWKNFPQDRVKYLNLTKDVIGAPNKNVRLVWLALCLSTKGYDAPNIEQHLSELLEYSSSIYNAQTREEAFRWLFAIQACNEECKANLEQAKTHHNWRLVKYAKKALEGN